MVTMTIKALKKKGALMATLWMIGWVVLGSAWAWADEAADVSMEHRAVEAVSEAEAPVMETADDPADIPPVPESGLTPEELDLLEKRLSVQLFDRLRETVREELRRDMRIDDRNWLDRMHLSVPEWSRRIRLSGDFRFRYEGAFYNEDNTLILDPQTTSSLVNTRETQNRFRMRARIGVNAEINKQADLTVRLATGSSGNPVSTNETLGDYLNKDSILIDLAYLKLQPMPTRPELTVMMGRFPTPYVGSDLIFDGDLGFEGLAVSYDRRRTGTFGPILALGAYPLQEEEWYSDKWLFGGQMGFEYRPSRDLAFVLASAYYHYENIKGRVNSPAYPELHDWTSPLFQQKGNTLINISADSTTFTPGLASDFRLADLTAYVDCAWYYPVHVIMTIQAVENLGFDKDDIQARTGVDKVYDDTTGYKAELLVGHTKVRNFGQWQWAFAYRHVGADAVLDAFTDSDFHMGGTNARGWNLKGEFGLFKNTWLTAQWITSNEINGPQLSIDQFQLDLSASF